ncbi:FapA family protein [Aeromonas caviae]|uniref:FapA family protein n=1 Tax=Aeromonas caviae TaxID=648 RepID=UPI0030EB3DEE
MRNGIIGRKLADDEYLCHLNAGGEIHASYAQYARLEADGDIHILSQLSHCYCRSGQDLKVGDSAMRKGHLIGGINIANRLIMAPVLGASAANRTRLQILGGYFSQKEQELALRQRKQTCAEQIDKLQDLILRLLQLPRDKRNPETLQKIKALRTRQFRREQEPGRAARRGAAGTAGAHGQHGHHRHPAPLPRRRGGDGPSPQQGRYRARPHPLRHPGRSAATDPLPGPALRGNVPPRRQAA